MRTTMNTQTQQETKHHDSNAKGRTTNKDDLTLLLDEFLLAYVFSFLGGGKNKSLLVEKESCYPMIDHDCINTTHTSSRNKRKLHQLLGYGASYGGGDDGGSSGRLMTVQEAGRLHGVLASVCSRWRTVCHHNLKDIVGLLQANLTTTITTTVSATTATTTTTTTTGIVPRVAAAVTTTSTRLDLPRIEWMCRNNVRVGSILPRCVLWLNDKEVQYFLRLLRECDTTNLKKLWVSFATDYWRCSRRAKHYQLQTTIYETIAETCPNLEEAALTCRLSLWWLSTHQQQQGVGRPQAQPQPHHHHQQQQQQQNDNPLLAYDESYSCDRLKPFFSLSKLRRLQWTIDCCENTPPSIRGTLGAAIVTRLISNLPALERLELRGEANQFLDGSLPVRSNSLRALDLSNLGRLLQPNQLVVLCLCPKLLRIELPHRDTRVQHCDSEESFELAIRSNRGQIRREDQ